MAQTIYKYELTITDEQILTLPAAALPLAVQWQRRTLRLWAQVNLEQPMVRRRVFIVGTGHVLPDEPGLLYVGTVQQEGGALIWHVYVSSIEVQETSRG